MNTSRGPSQLVWVAMMFCALALFAPPAQSGSPAGVYVGQIQGQRVELRLEPGGQASLLGHTYRFDRQGRYSYQYYMSVSIPSDMADGTGEGEAESPIRPKQRAALSSTATS